MAIEFLRACNKLRKVLKLKKAAQGQLYLV